MFDTVAAEVAPLAQLGAARRAESAATARTLRLAAEALRESQDGGDDVAAEFAILEVADALQVPRGMAWSMVNLGEHLRDRLPAVGAALACGDLDYPRARALADRLARIDDAELRAAVETAVLATVLGRAGTTAATTAAADRVVARLAPAFARDRVRRAAQDRELRVNPAPDGMAAVYGLLTATDGRALDHCLATMTTHPCPDDPRTSAQRRADALISLVNGQRRLRCACPHPGCTAGSELAARTDKNSPQSPVPDDPDPTDPGPAEPKPAPDPPGPPAAHRITRHKAAPGKVVLHLVVAAETIAGAADLPGVLRRMGILDADTVRALAADATWKQLLTLNGTPRPPRARPPRRNHPRARGRPHTDGPRRSARAPRRAPRPGHRPDRAALQPRRAPRRPRP